MEFGDKFNNNRHIGKKVVINDQAELHYISVGHGVPVLFIHGMMQSLYTWRHNVQPLSNDFQCIAVDLPGSGYSDSPEMDYGCVQMTAALLAFCDALELESVHVVGTGTGAAYAMAFALEHPNRVKKLVLESPGEVGRGYPWRIRLMRYRGIGELMAYYLSEKSMEEILLRSYFDETRITPLMTEQVWLPMLMPGAREAMLSGLRCFDFNETCERMHEIQKPTLLVWGDHDAFHPIARMRTYEIELPRLQTTTINNCGHLTHEERAREFNNHILAFLRAPYNVEADG